MIYALLFSPAMLVAALASPQPAASPQVQTSPAVTPAEEGAWIAGHLPSQYDEVLAGTTNTITARYSSSGCKITVAFDYGTDFNSAQSSDRSPAFSVKGNPLTGHHFDGSDNGGTIDFTIVSPSSLRVSDATEYLGTEEVTPSSFEFTFRNAADAKAMLDAMTSFANACAPAAPH